jgi:DNA-directed RNA polymerase subunit RPC12/RpoP
MNHSSACPQCGSKAFKRNGYTRHGKQNHRCLDCGRQFSMLPTDIDVITQPIETIDNLNDDFPIQKLC